MQQYKAAEARYHAEKSQLQGQVRRGGKGWGALWPAATNLHLDDECDLLWPCLGSG